MLDNSFHRYEILTPPLQKATKTSANREKKSTSTKTRNDIQQWENFVETWLAWNQRFNRSPSMTRAEISAQRKEWWPQSIWMFKLKGHYNANHIKNSMAANHSNHIMSTVWRSCTNLWIFMTMNEMATDVHHFYGRIKHSLFSIQLIDLLWVQNWKTVFSINLTFLVFILFLPLKVHWLNFLLEV